MRILAFVDSCKGCENRRYESGGIHNCKLVDEPIRDENRVAPFCPLPSYPSGVISSLEATIQSLREQNTYSFHFAIFSYIAMKLKARLPSDSRYIHLLIKKGAEEEKDFYIVIDRITQVDHERSRVHFLASDGTPPKKYVISLGQRCELYEVVEVDGKELNSVVNFRVAE